MDIDKLEAGRKTDALVAEHVMEYKRDKAGNLLPPGFVASDWFALANSGAPPYSTLIWATWEMEKMIEQRGFNLRYAQAFMAVLLSDGLEPEHDEELWWALIHASPNQRCRAALKAVNAGQE